MPFSEAQITHAIEQGLRRTSTLDTPKVVRITCEDVYFLRAERKHIRALWCQHHCRWQGSTG